MSDNYLRGYPRHSLTYRKELQETSVLCFKTIGDLDQSVEILSKSLDAKVELYLELDDKQQELKTKLRLDIKRIKHALEIIASKKIELTVKHYDFLDLNIKAIDAELTLLENALLKSGRNIPVHDSLEPAVDSSRNNMNMESGLKRKRGRPKLFNPQTSATEDSLTQSAGTAGSSSTGGGIAGINEPVYCICKRVAFGEMIACDNEDCPIEWYHYSCVNLTRKPRNSWICHTCSSNKKKKSGS